MFRQAVTADVGKPRESERAVISDNVTIYDGRGNSLRYTLNRLQRDRPDLFDRVRARELRPMSTT